MIARDRVEHAAAKYGANLVIDARELLQLLNQIDQSVEEEEQKP